MEIAQLNNIPPFIVFTDVSLKEMSTYFPINVENMLKITGVGVSKLEKYGKIFIDTISKYVEENNIKIDVIGGTSSGALIASLYAMGYSPYYIYLLFFVFHL